MEAVLVSDQKLCFDPVGSLVVQGIPVVEDILVETDNLVVEDIPVLADTD